MSGVMCRFQSAWKKYELFPVGRVCRLMRHECVLFDIVEVYRLIMYLLLQGPNFET